MRNILFFLLILISVPVFASTQVAQFFSQAPVGVCQPNDANPNCSTGELNWQSISGFGTPGAFLTSSGSGVNWTSLITGTSNGTLQASNFIGQGSAIYGVPSLYGTTYHAFGDSITFGYSADPITNGYAYQIGYDLGVAVTDYGIPSATACDVADEQVFKYENPTTAQNTIYTLMDGINDAVFYGVGAGELNYTQCHTASLAWLTIPSAYKTFGNNRTSTTGSWFQSFEYGTGIGIYSTTNGSTATLTLKTYGKPIYIWYRMKNTDGGTFTYAVDGGASSSTITTGPVTPIQYLGFWGVGFIRIPNIAAGTHTVVFTVTSATSSSNHVYIESIGTPSPYPYLGQPTLFVGGVTPYPGTVTAPTLAAYNADALADVNLLIGDSLNVHFVPVNNYLDPANLSSSISYLPGPHPNNTGQLQLRDAFESVMQFVFQLRNYFSPGISNINTANNFVINGITNWDANTPLTVNGNTSPQVVNNAVYETVITASAITPNNGQVPVGEFAGYQYGEGQSFVLSSTTVITGASFLFSLITGHPTGTVTYKIETNSGGLPTGTLVNANAIATIAAPVTTNVNKVEFTPFVLSPGTYWLVAIDNSTESSGNAWTIGVQSGNPYGSLAANLQNTTWQTTAYNIIFSIYGYVGSAAPALTPAYLLTGNNGTLAKIQANTSDNSLAIINNLVTALNIDSNGITSLAGINWTSLKNLSSSTAGINWNNLTFNNFGINWTNFVDLGTQNTNWYDINLITNSITATTTNGVTSSQNNNSVFMNIMNNQGGQQ